jgi:pilus assembly protein CpaF
MESDVIQIQELFRFVRHGIAPDGQILGAFVATGVRPSFVEELKVRGFSVPNTLFGPGAEVN